MRVLPAGDRQNDAPPILDVLEFNEAAEIAEDRHAVGFDPGVGTGGRQVGSERVRSRRPASASTRRREREIHGLPALAALAASHHHTVGNADTPYFGNGLGRLKRSQRAVRNLL